MKRQYGRGMRWRRALVLVGYLGVVATGLCAVRLQRWLYYPINLSQDSQVVAFSNTLSQAWQCGYTHVLLSDAKFCVLDRMNSHYFANVEAVKQVAASLGIQIVPAVFPMGYSNDLLAHDPNLIEAMPVTNSLLVVSNGFATPQAEPPIAFPPGGFSNLSLWDWHDSTVGASGGAAMIANPNGRTARIVDTLTVSPFRQYHISVRLKTQNFAGTPQVQVLADGLELTYNSLGALRTQNWTTHHVVFNSLTNTAVTVYFGCWNGTTGILWLDDPFVEEVTFLNLVRRPGTPLVVQQEDGLPLVEGVDYPTFRDPGMGANTGGTRYDVYHTPPLLPVTATNGTRLRASWSHAVTVFSGQAMICPSEPATLSLLQDQAQRVHAAFGAPAYFMWYDEIRTMNWCPACQARNLDAGVMLANSVSNSIQILRHVNPGGGIYVWSDMFDPNHNACANYYLVRGDLTNSWLGLDAAVSILPWDYELRTNTLQFFSSRGHQQVIAAYNDDSAAQVTNWLQAGSLFPGVCGVMYTTWQSAFEDLEPFSELVSGWEIQNSWQAAANLTASGLRLEMPTVSNRSYTVWRSADLLGWQAWTNFTATSPIGRCVDSEQANSPIGFYRLTTP